MKDNLYYLTICHNLSGHQECTAKNLYITKRVRPDIEMTVYFLCAQVSKSNIKDWHKLNRMLGFFKRTVNDVKIIGATSIQDLYMWVDAACTVHPNMRSHMGGTMSFGWGIVHKRASKQKVNTKSSTEAEVVGVSE
eukprot:8787797-Ditylum_brightwellii.AAC.1